ncbi:hypothetical protein ACFWB0_10565 [Rhodococcus sp. NPDC060086]|uniref:hypothetical protein n=1 Tax=Rhodococcus sp. NPDC060086 TaxID=3347055 RepID=UPI00364DB1CC
MYKRIGEFAAVAAPVRDPMTPARVFTAPPAVVPDRVVRPARWERRYEVSVLCCDVLCLALANLIVAVGYRPVTALADGQRIAVIVVCTAVTVLSIAFQKGWDSKSLGSGTGEYRRIVRAYLYAVAASAILAYSLGADQARVYIFVALPLALVLTLAARKALRSMVLHARRQGRCLRSVLVVGNAEEVHELVSRTNGAGESGWKVEGICLADATGEDALPVPRGSPVAIDDVPVLGTDADIIRITEIHKFDAVALLPSDRCSYAKMRKLDRDLEVTGVDLLLAPVLIDNVGPRLHISPLAGLPLLQVSAPRYGRPARVVERIVDRMLALVAPWRHNGPTGSNRTDQKNVSSTSDSPDMKGGSYVVGDRRRGVHRYTRHSRSDIGRPRRRGGG